MAKMMNADSPGFEAQFARLLGRESVLSESVPRIVAEIIANVRADGDDAVFAYTAEFDGFEARKSGTAFTRKEIDNAVSACAPKSIAALKVAAERIESYHKKQMPEDKRYTDNCGVGLGWRWTPVDAVGLYVPGGRAAYPSSVLMNAIPAKVAGVERLVMVVPTPNGEINPLVLAAAHLVGITEIYRIGGAQAVAALAYGTDTIKPVDKIVGPGNMYVAEAKRQVFGRVGIDSIAGPSEILVVADSGNDPNWIAADLLSQAEHDTVAQSVLITDSRDFALAVAEAAERMIEQSPRRAVTEASWINEAAIIKVGKLEEALPLINRLAPEHLELAVADPEAMVQGVRHAGAIFLGRYTPEAIGDYVAGPDHVLPTSQAARFSSGLSALDFLKRTSLISCTPEALAVIGPAAVTLADEEGLWAHAESIRVRLK